MRAVFIFAFLFVSSCATISGDGRAFCAELRGRARLAESLSRIALVGAGAGAALAAPETSSGFRVSVAISGAALAAIGAGLVTYAADARDEREEFCARRAKTSTSSEK